MSLSRNILVAMLLISSVTLNVNAENVYANLLTNNGIMACWPDSLHQMDTLKVDTLPLQDSLKIDTLPLLDSLNLKSDNLNITNPDVIMLADSIIEYGKKFLGVPYCHGHGGPDMFDCSGFTSFVFRPFGYELSRSSSGQLADGWKIIDNQNDLVAGDLVFFGGRKNYTSIGHVGIVVENFPEESYFTFIHATVSRGVIISKSNEKYYIIRYIKGCRVLPEYY